MTVNLPVPVGPLSEAAIQLLSGPTDATWPPLPVADGDDAGDDDAFDDDRQLALYILNETHYAGWTSVSDDFEWHPAVHDLRRRLNSWFEAALRRSLPSDRTDPLAEAERLLDTPGPSVSAFLAESGTIDDLRRSMVFRSPYQSKEADPHTFALPRFSGEVKRVLCDIQAGEYGVGHRSSHAELFAAAMVGLDLDPTPNAHVDRCGGAALATSNLVTLGSMQRRLRGVTLGQLALFEMDSVVPNGRMVTACDRLGLPASVRRFFDVHVMADAEHEVLVKRAFLTDYPKIEPAQVDNLLLGMRAQHLIDRRVAAELVPVGAARRR